MYSRLCMCDVCTEGRLLRGKKKGEKKKGKNEKKENVPRRAGALFRCPWVTD